MARRLLPVGFRLFKDNGEYAGDGAAAFKLAGTSTAVQPYSDQDLTTPIGPSVAFDAMGYAPDIWGDDNVSYKITLFGTGVTARTIDYAAIGDSTESSSTETEPGVKNAVRNGAFNTWSGGTSFSNLSGDGDGDEVADGWYLSQPNAAANAVSRQNANSVGARYALRFGRPQSSSSTDELRLWQTPATDEVYRLRGKTVTVSVGLVAGADFSAAAGLSILLASGTSAGEDGDGMAAGTWGGYLAEISVVQALTTTLVRYQFTADLATNIGELGLQISYAPTGTAGANDWVQIEDVQIEAGEAASAFEALPEPLDFLRTSMTTFFRAIVDDADAEEMRATLGASAVGDALFTAADAPAARSTLGASSVGGAIFTAADAAAARAATGAAASGANTDIASVYLANAGLKVADTDASHGLTIKPGSNLTADRTLTVTTGDADRALDISAGDVTITAAGAALLDDADAGAQRTTLGLGTAALVNDGTSGGVHGKLNADKTDSGTNTFSGVNTFTNDGGGAITLSSIAPGIKFVETDNSNNYWQVVLDGGVIGLRYNGAYPGALQIDGPSGAAYFAARPAFGANTPLDSGNVSTYALPIGGGTLTGNVRIASTGPDFVMHETDAGPDAKHWGVYINAGTMQCYTTNDAQTSYHVWINAARSADVVSTVAVYADLIVGDPSAAVAATNTCSVGYRGLGPPAVKTDAYTFALADAGRVVRGNHSASKVYTIPTNASVAFPNGTIVPVENINSGTMVLTPDTGVTLYTDDGTSGAVTVSQHQGGSLIKDGDTATNVWRYRGSYT
jgi:hypothetical protein